MKIVQLTAENFKRLVAVSITPDGTLCEITGRNAAGKSSCLDAIEAALGGKGAAPDRPIREGQESARVVLDLDGIRVTRKWTASGTTLQVESEDGARYPSPQSVLDGLVGKLSFDPLAFSRMDAKTQAETLRKVVGIDLSEQDRRRAALFEERTAQNRAAKAVSAQLAGMPEVEAPEAVVSMAEVIDRQRAALQVKQENDARRHAIIVYERAKEQANALVEKLQAELAAARANFDSLCQKECPQPGPDPDLEAIVRDMRDLEYTNAKVRARQARKAKADELAIAEGAAATLTRELEKIDQAKAEALAAVKFPVPGLSVDGDEVTLNGVPFSQSSSAEQLRVGLAIGAALNPKLRVVLVRDGSLLDADGLRAVAEWAEWSGMQVIMERVADGTGRGVVIEDGQVLPRAEAPQVGEQQGLRL